MAGAPRRPALFELAAAPKTHGRGDARSGTTPGGGPQLSSAASAARLATADANALTLALARAEVEKLVNAKARELDLRGAIDAATNSTRARSIVVQALTTEAGQAALTASVERERRRGEERRAASAALGVVAESAAADEQESASARLGRQLDRAIAPVATPDGPISRQDSKPTRRLPHQGSKETPALAASAFGVPARVGAVGALAAPDETSAAGSRAETPSCSEGGLTTRQLDAGCAIPLAALPALGPTL
ncbi:hypothetical protein T492DRAFT_892020 [Pavlovales sp. CCMP2436]|nr:hypothetical protein T492DRAFT_892020 [Pavlovales sp. CCMP2436]